MAKYNEELVEKVVFLIEEECYTITQVCKATGISRQAFYGWMDTRPEFKYEVEQAMSRRDEALMTMVHASLKKKLEGYHTTEEKDVYVPDEHTGEIVFKQKTITKKECPPDLRTIKMLLERQDRKNSPSLPPQGEEKDEERYIENRKREEPVEDITLNPAEAILETCAEGIAEYPPKNEHIKKDMQILTSSQKRKAEHKKKKNTTTKDIRKSVKFVKF